MRSRSTAAVLALLLAAVAACGGPAPPPAVPVIVPSDPASLARWEASQANVFRSKLSVVDLACFRGKMTEKGHGGAEPVAVEMDGALDSGVATEQAEALRRFKAAEPAVYARVRAAVYDEYRKSYPTFRRALSPGESLYGSDGGDSRGVLPGVVKGHELDGLISFSTVRVGRPKQGVSRIGIELNCPWDEENGMGVLVEDGAVVGVGDAGTAMLP